MFQNYLELPAMKSYKNTGGSFGGFYFFFPAKRAQIQDVRCPTGQKVPLGSITCGCRGDAHHVAPVPRAKRQNWEGRKEFGEYRCVEKGSAGS